jgi:hypothetical protein
LFCSYIRICSAQSALFLENYSYYNGNFYTLINVYAKHALSERLYLVGFSMVTNVWGENLIGLNYQISPWLQVEAKAGVETHPECYRFSPMFLIRKNRLKYFFAYEYGGSGWWFTSRLEYDFGWMKSGFRANRTIGYGPRIDILIPETMVYLWLGYTFEWEGVSGPLIGIYSTFGGKKNDDPTR